MGLGLTSTFTPCYTIRSFIANNTYGLNISIPKIIITKGTTLADYCNITNRSVLLHNKTSKSIVTQSTEDLQQEPSHGQDVSKIDRINEEKHPEGYSQKKRLKLDRSNLDTSNLLQSWRVRNGRNEYSPFLQGSIVLK